MKTNEFYVEKAKELIEKAKSTNGVTDENGLENFPDMKSLSRELVHLIYSYDNTLPLLDEAKGLMSLSFSDTIFEHERHKYDFRKFNEVCDYFIYYIEELSRS